MEPIYDVFLSFSGADREPGRELATELRALGLRVFLDEDGIEPFTGITDGIEHALRTTKTLVAYYSADYATRPACQRELMTVFLAGQREGSPCRRIMVINPERDTDHLRPIELADAKFVLPSTGVVGLARQVMKRVAEIDRPVGEVLPARHLGWSAPRASRVRNFVGRYRELWDLHSALLAADYPFIQETACGAFAAVCGLPGAGKTSLVTNYAWRFAAAFPGGTHWLSLAGQDALGERYARELRRIAPELGIDPAAVGEDRLADSIAQHLRGTGTSTLWIIDDVPDDVGPEILDLPFPTDTLARTVLVSNEDVFRGLMPVVHVGPLPESDGATLLDRYRPTESAADRCAREHILRRLGGNAAALVTVGEHLQDRQGLSSYTSFLTELDTAGAVTDLLFGSVRRLVDRMGPVELALLRLADRTGTTVFPAQLLAALPGLSRVDVGEALKRLLARSAASRTSAVWRLDPLVVRAARGHSHHADVPDIPLAQVNDVIDRISSFSGLTHHEKQVSHEVATAEPSLGIFHLGFCWWGGVDRVW
ncbi:tetratricopeptide repeat protein [Amycolatopsis anabasis]|uniref:tetratricopeptide repeat protein n=1 Tax=Amycolatopsis anabasis TaxID=1840409 RepID=UPI001FEAE30D|nr:TIR domain-containing protein [Amycolatopsis anabasis]